MASAKAGLPLHNSYHILLNSSRFGTHTDQRREAAEQLGCTGIGLVGLGWVELGCGSGWRMGRWVPTFKALKSAIAALHWKSPYL